MPPPPVYPTSSPSPFLPVYSDFAETLILFRFVTRKRGAFEISKFRRFIVIISTHVLEMRGWRRGLRALKKASLETFSSCTVLSAHSLLLNLFCIHWRSQAISFEDKSVDLNEYIWGRLRDPCQSPCVSHTTRSTDFPRVCKTRVIL